MSFDDLNLEFEDEEEFNRKKKSDAVHVDVDLVFQTQENASPKPGPAPRPIPVRPHPSENVQSLPQRPMARPLPESGPVSTGATAIRMVPQAKTDPRSEDELLEHVRKIEFDAEVKVRVADFKAEILGEVLSDMKLMEHQVGQLLARINAKHPDMKQEVLMIKKLLADFTAKKRK